MHAGRFTTQQFDVTNENASETERGRPDEKDEKI